MLDTYVIRNVTERVDSSVTIHEHKAPTDESVKLLNEMTQKVLDNITKNLSTSNNSLQIRCYVYDDHRLGQRLFLGKFTLNGKNHEFQIDIDMDQFDTPYKMLNKVYTVLCSKLAAEMMQPLFEEMKRNYLK